MSAVPKPKQRKPKSLKKECDALWAECVKTRAGYCSEWSGLAGRQIGGEKILAAHHLVGKAGHRLRYDLDNGFCCTTGEHSFIFHNQGRVEAARERVKKLRGRDIFERLSLLRGSKSDLMGVKVYLENELKKLSDSK